MAFEHQDGHGTIFKNDKGDNSQRPDYRGGCRIGGITYEIAGWIKEGSKGKYLSLAISLPKEREPSQVTSDPAAEGEDIPF